MAIPFSTVANRAMAGKSKITIATRVTWVLQSSPRYCWPKRLEKTIEASH
jgi:hypothetical protein